MISARVKAFLDMLAKSEGTAGHGDDGYNILVGYGRFKSYADHPRRLIELPNLGIKSTAAGRYQIREGIFDHYAKKLGLKDFSPASQDDIAVELIRERGAIALIEQGKIPEAIARVRKIWASLPGAGYGQHEQDLKQVLAWYDKFYGNRKEAEA